MKNWYKAAARPSMSYQSALSVFGFPAGSSPSAEEIRSRYRQLVMQSNHGDRGQQAGTIDIIQLNNAHEVLKNTSQTATPPGRASRPPNAYNEYSRPRSGPYNDSSSGREQPAWQTDSRSSYNDIPEGADFRNLNYCLKTIYEHSLKNGAVTPYTFAAFDGYYFRSNFTAKTNEASLGFAGEAMRIWNSDGGNPYQTAAVVAAPKDGNRWQVVQIKGQDVTGRGLFLETEEFLMPWNDPRFSPRLQDLISTGRSERVDTYASRKMAQVAAIEAPSASAQIGIDISAYERSLRGLVQSLIQSTQDRHAGLANFQFNLANVQAVLSKHKYAGLPTLLTALNSGNTRQMENELFNLWQFERETSKSTGWRNVEDLHMVNRHVRDYVEHLETTAPDYKPYGADASEQDIQVLLQGTRQNMEKIAQEISRGVSRIQNWRGTPLMVVAHMATKEDYLSGPQSSASIEFAPAEDETNPSFTYFLLDNTVEVDDVLEAGDTDFFRDGGIQSDYFSLLKEIKNPGSTSKNGKVLTLYTARPVKDRQMYMNTNQIPSNLFLTNNYSSAIGLANDLAGGEPRRDVWKVRIDSRYLVQTLDGMEKQYQVVGDGMVPVVSMSLVDEGGSGQGLTSSNWYSLSKTAAMIPIERLQESLTKTVEFTVPGQWSWEIWSNEDYTPYASQLARRLVIRGYLKQATPEDSYIVKISATIRRGADVPHFYDVAERHNVPYDGTEIAEIYNREYPPEPVTQFDTEYGHRLIKFRAAVFNNKGQNLLNPEGLAGVAKGTANYDDAVLDGPMEVAYYIKRLIDSDGRPPPGDDDGGPAAPLPTDPSTQNYEPSNQYEGLPAPNREKQLVSFSRRRSMKKVFDLSKEAGHQIMPSLNEEQHPSRPGLEGPFRLRSGKVVYYDALEGKYYDPSTDMYMSDDEYEQHSRPGDSANYGYGAKLREMEQRRNPGTP